MIQFLGGLSTRAVSFLYMKWTLAHIGPRSGRGGDGFDDHVQGYLQRIASFVSCEAAPFRSEPALLEWLAKKPGRSPATLVLLDSRGKQMTSEVFAAWLGARRDEGTQHIVFAIGPADGWNGETRSKAHLLLSLGPMTLAHSLARVVMAEQLYRACTILAGHPYHTGH